MTIEELRLAILELIPGSDVVVTHREETNDFSKQSVTHNWETRIHSWEGRFVSTCATDAESLLVKVKDSVPYLTKGIR